MRWDRWRCGNYQRTICIRDEDAWWKSLATGINVNDNRYLPMRRRDITAAVLSFRRISLVSISAVSSVANSFVVEPEADIFELLLSTRRSGKVSSGATPLIREPWCSPYEEFEAIDKAQLMVNSIPWRSTESKENITRIKPCQIGAEYSSSQGDSGYYLTLKRRSIAPFGIGGVYSIIQVM